MTLKTVKQIADGLLAVVFAAAALFLLGIVVFFGIWDAWRLHVGVVFFAAMAAMCVRDILKRRRTDAR